MAITLVVIKDAIQALDFLKLNDNGTVSLSIGSIEYEIGTWKDCEINESTDFEYASITESPWFPELWIRIMTEHLLP